MFREYIEEQEKREAITTKTNSGQVIVREITPLVLFFEQNYNFTSGVKYLW
jgi:hypothetical protein